MSAGEQVITVDQKEGTRGNDAATGSGPAPAGIGHTSSDTVCPLRRLPDERRAITHHVSIAEHEGYLTVGVYKDGSPGEIFVRMAKQGSTISGLMASFAIVVSIASQHGVPLGVLCAKFKHTRFEPSGWSGNPKIAYAKSIPDYLFRWLELKFITNDQGDLFGALPTANSLLSGENSADPVGALGELIHMGHAPAGGPSIDA